MYREVTIDNDKDFLLLFWKDEQRSVKWYRESNETDDCTDETFINFCNRHRIFAINESALLYTQEVEPQIIMLHFSVLRRTKDDLTEDLMQIRNQLFREGAKIIFGWVLKHNRGLKKICVDLGLRFNGTTSEMEREGKKPFIRECYVISRESLFTFKDSRCLLLSN